MQSPSKGAFGFNSVPEYHTMSVDERQQQKEAIERYQRYGLFQVLPVLKLHPVH